MHALSKHQVAAIQAAVNAKGETLSEEQLRLLADLIECIGGIEAAHDAVQALANLEKAA